ncbi:MAG: gamma-glutamyltransferase [Planctomycetota bacterium]
MKRIAEGGRDVFYKGEMARTIADFVQSQGGYLSEEDLALHHGEWVDRSPPPTAASSFGSCPQWAEHRRPADSQPARAV